MKQLLLLPILIAFSIQGYAQCTAQWVVDEDFSTTTLSNPPDCWSVEGNPAAFDFSSGYAIVSGFNSFLVLPETQNLQGVLTFNARQSSRFTLNGFILELGVWENGSFTILTSFALSPPSFQTFTYDFSNYTGSAKNIAFRGNNSTYHTLIDDVHYQSQCTSSSSATALAKDITVQLDASGNVIVNPAQVDDGSFNSCEAPITNLSLDKTLFTCDDLGANTVTLTADDGFGNVATATATVTVEPNVVLGFSNVFLDENGSLEVTDEFALSSTTTICSPITYSYSQNTFDCTDVGSLTFEITATYPGGSVTKSATVSVLDEIDPVAVAQDLMVSIDETTGLATITAEQADNGSTDNCAVTSISVSRSTFTCADQGENEVELTVFDDAGGSHSTTFTVTVNSYIPDVDVSAANTEVCFDGDNSNAGVEITTDGSLIGADYYLRKSFDESVVDGPIQGTGSGLTFNTGSVSESTTFQVYAEVPASGMALSLPGSSQHLSLAAPGSFDYSQGYTFSAWVKESLGGISNSFDPIFYAGGTTGSDIEVYLNSNTGSLTIVHNRGNGGTNDFLLTSSALLPNNEYAHLTVAFNGLTVRVYVDGVEKASKAIAAPQRSVGSELAFGYLNNTGFPGFQSFNGVLDDIRIYDTAREPFEVSQDMNRCLTGNEEDLVLYFDLESINSTIITDLVSNTPAQLINGGTLTDDFAISCSFSCNKVMTTEITVGDSQAPTVITQNITVTQGMDGTTNVSPEEIDNGSSDNCTSTENLTLTLDISEFDCDQLGDNSVTLTVTDEAGNSSSSDAVVTIISAIDDQAVSTESANVCPGSVATVTVASSQSGVQYYLRDASEEIVDGPVEGNGQAIDFQTPTLVEQTTYNVFGALPPPEDDAAKLAGSSGYVSIPTSNTLQLTEDWTLEAWVKSASTTATVNIIETYDINGGFVLRAAGGNWIAYAMQSSSVFSFLESATEVEPNVWTHVAATFNEETNELKIYVNGVLDATNTLATIDQRSSNVPIKLGARGDDNRIHSEHEQDEVRIWNVERSAEEILANKDRKLSGQENGLLAYYNYNNLPFASGGMQILDLGPNANHGFMVGTYTQENFVEGVFSNQASECGRQMATTVTITPSDSEAPTVLTRNITVRLDEDNEVVVTPEEVDNGSFDNCGEVTLSLTLPQEEANSAASAIDPRRATGSLTFDETQLGSNEVVLEVFDEFGNRSIGGAVVTVEPNKLEQAINFATISDKSYGEESFNLEASASSGLPVNLGLVSGPGELSGSLLQILGAGTIVVRASQEGNDEYAAAETVEQSIVVRPADLTVIADNQLITYGSIIPTLSFSYNGFVNGDTEDDLLAAPTISIDASIEEGPLTAGTYDILLSGGEADNYTFSFTNGTLTVNKADQVITVDEIADVEPGNDPIEITASVDSGLPLTYAITGPATLSGTTITLDGTEGTVVVSVSQAGDANHNATSATVSFEVGITLSLEKELLENVKIFPNPTVDFIQIDASEEVVVRLFSLNGNLLVTKQLVAGSIDISAFENGIYMMKILKSDESITRRIIKTN